MCQHEQELLFSDVVANGTSSWTPSSGVLPQHMQEEMEEESQCEHVEDFENIPQSEPQISTLNDTPTDATPVEEPISSRRKSTEFLNRLRNRKAKKVTNADKISMCLQRMVDAMEHESTRNIVDTGSQYSIKNCLEILGNMPEIVEGDTLWMYATRIFLKPAIRELFMTIKKKDEIRFKWLEEQMERDKRRRAN